MGDLLLSWFSSAFPFFLVQIFGMLFLQRPCALLDFSSSSGVILRFSITPTLVLQMIHSYVLSCRTGANLWVQRTLQLTRVTSGHRKILTNLPPAEVRLFMPDRPVLLPWYRCFPWLLYCFTFTGSFSTVLGGVSGYIFYIDSTVLLVALVLSSSLLFNQGMAEWVATYPSCWHTVRLWQGKSPYLNTNT